MNCDEQVYGGNGYAEFSAYATNDSSNIGWLISPGIDMNAQEGEVLNFQTEYAYPDSGHTIEVFIYRFQWSRIRYFQCDMGTLVRCRYSSPRCTLPGLRGLIRVLLIYLLLGLCILLLNTQVVILLIRIQQFILIMLLYQYPNVNYQKTCVSNHRFF